MTGSSPRDALAVFFGLSFQLIDFFDNLPGFLSVLFCFGFNFPKPAETNVPNKDGYNTQDCKENGNSRQPPVYCVGPVVQKFSSEFVSQIIETALNFEIGGGVIYC